MTIHTPVPAGNERFDANLVRRLAGQMLPGVDFDRVIELGRSDDAGEGIFDMTAFCLRNTRAHNGVSLLHGETAKNTWAGVSRQPIAGLTNGVHMPSWVGRSLQLAFEEHGCDFDDMNGPGATRLWEQMGEVSDEKLWKAHLRQKAALGHFARGRLRSQLSRHGQPPEVLGALQGALDPNTLTLGFARRFATYKRAALLFRDEDRLARLMWDEERPVQIVFAGKAHPADRPGQAMIQKIFEMSRSERFKGRVFILEDYDMRIGRFMTQGVDVWLNNTRRPLEASGTSGMKAAANGIPNCSILDGWWDEGFHNDNGWAIGGRDQHGSDEEQDHHDAESLYAVLEDGIVPEYYERENGLPTRWIARMRAAIGSSLWQFSTARMVQEYTKRMYTPAARNRS
ncbi:MAG: alpha-glucan family phosphorylase [Deltaproteobacteria bacterium]|nr:alpha-glucan family phosphorylase [Deltaproteobacteria bacterium]